MPTAQLNLQTFLDRVASIVDRAIGEQNSFIRISMRPLFSAAWSEVEQGLPSVRSAVGQLSDDVLAGVGLSGAQLSLKLAGFGYAADRLDLGWTDKMLRKVLGWINLILGSLLAAVPAAEPIKELKEALERELDEVSDK